jgi:hypothetical protein
MIQVARPLAWLGTMLVIIVTSGESSDDEHGSGQAEGRPGKYGEPKMLAGRPLAIPDPQLSWAAGDERTDGEACYRENHAGGRREVNARFHAGLPSRPLPVLP